MLAPDISNLTYQNARHILIPYLQHMGDHGKSMVPWYVNLEAYIADNTGLRKIYRKEDGVDKLYLHRSYIYRGPECEIMIHRFFMGDKGPLHDHPASSYGTILDVGYNERLCTHLSNTGLIDEDGYPIMRTEGEYEVSRVPGDWSYRPAATKLHDNFETFHKVKLRSPNDAGKVVTFFVMEKRTDRKNGRDWGFRDNDGYFVPFEQMDKQENLEEKQSAPDQYGTGWFPRRIR